MNMEHIEQLAKAAADSREKLKSRVLDLQQETDRIKRRRLASIKKAAVEAQTRFDELRSAIDGNRTLFDKPRSRSLHGLKVGLQKGKGQVSYISAEKVVERIKEKLPDQYDQLVKTSKAPVKSALQNLSVKELRSIGVTVSNSGDQVLIKTTDSEIDKLVNALFEEDLGEAEASL